MHEILILLTNNSTMKKEYFILVLAILVSTSIQAQEKKTKKPVDFTVYDGWKVIERQAISNDGKWVSYELTPYKGDGELIVMNPDKIEKKVFPRGTKAVFSPGSKFIAFKIVPQADSIRKLKFIKAKKENFPKDSLVIWVFKDDKTIEAENINSFKVPEEKSDWLAYLYEKNADDPDNSKKENNEKLSKKNTKKNKDAPDVFDLVILNPISNAEYRFKDVSEFNFSKNGKLLGFIQVKGDSAITSKVSFFDTENEDIIKVFDKDGLAKNIVVDNGGLQGSFIFSADTSKTKTYNLHIWSKGMIGSTEVVLDKNSLDMPKDWYVSENGTTWFSRDDTKLYFGTAMKIETEQKDTLLDEEKVKVDVWSWTDPLLQSQQLIDLKKEEKRNYLTVFHIKEKQVARLANEAVPEVKTLLFGNASMSLGVADEPFKLESSWQFPSNKDYYLIDVKTGNKKIVLEKASSYVDLSPFGNYIFWFGNEDSCWYTLSTNTKVKTALTKKIPVNFYDEEYDRPSVPPSYLFAGWTENDKYFLIYDRYDIWRIDPNGIEKPICLTNGFGRKNKIEFRYNQLDENVTYINSKETLLVSAFNKTNKQGGFYTVSINKASDPIKLVMEDFDYSTPIKAKGSAAMIWQKSSVTEFPDLWYSENLFADPTKISFANPQQTDYIWETAELVKWTTFDGKEEEGLLYKPEDFDPSKKYPMLVRFYELSSDRLHTHYYPRPSRSPINTLEYTSNGYLVFVPNIRYKVGNPGESAVNYVVSGTKSIIDKGFVDEKRIGIQGQSWGAYQVAFIITQTDLFKAACAEAPVSNMTSAYGSIYWQLGISRQSMYESDQSRIGASLWEKPDLYIHNSPIFYADKIETPLMIVHNDGDGAVPWDQGIQLFLALRRLNKPAWLINYNGEPHNLRDKSPDCKDLSIRMMQFFNSYLKDESSPTWMIKGIPAIKKGKTLGYEISN